MTLAVLIPMFGCQDQNGRPRPGHRLPAPLIRQPPFEFNGILVATYSGDSFEILEGQEKAHSVRLIGVDCPEIGQDKFREARRLAYRTLHGNTVKVSVVRRDEYMVDQCEVMVGQTNVGLSLIRCGLAWYNGDQFAGCEAYADAQSLAKQEKLEIWSLHDPVPPWKVYDELVEQKQKKAADGIKASGN
jgi:endonuclease YncB( thermonuclease family)